MNALVSAHASRQPGAAHLRILGVLGLAAASFIGACGDDGTSTTPDTNFDTLFSDSVTDTGPGGSDTSVPGVVRVLEFKNARGDDQRPCLQQPRCTISIGYNEVRPLELVYTEDGLPKAGQVVKFALENDAQNIGYISTLSNATDGQGISTVNTKPKVNNIGQFVVKAYIDNSAIPPKYFDVVVTPKGQVPLTVVANYAGQRPVGTYSVNLYKQNAAGVPGCEDMAGLLEDGTANHVTDNVLLAQSSKFPELDGLEQAGKQKYTILAYSKNANNAIQAWGCDATQGEVEWGKSKTVQVALLDRPPIYAGAQRGQPGSYEIISRFDFISAIPEPYRTYVDYVVGFFQSPTQTLFNVACDLMNGQDSQLNGFCDLLFDQDANGNVTSGTLGAFVFQLADSILSAVTQDTVFASILQGGGDVADILKAFEIRATLTVKKEPDASGKFADGDVTENWHTVKVKWTLGQNCDPDTEQGCGVRQFSINAFQSQAVTGNVPASVANYYDLTVAKHPLNLKYGALISYFLEAFLVPIVTGQPTVDTYEELLGYLVGGANSNCLTSIEPGTDCCGTFADKLVGDDDGRLESGSGGDGADAQAIYAACNTIQTAAPGFLRQTLGNLDLSSGDTFNVATKVACKLADPNGDLIIDQIGTQANPCLWDVTLKFSANAQTTIESVFWGARSE
jgi:hypothetical protein